MTAQEFKEELKLNGLTHKKASEVLGKSPGTIKFYANGMRAIPEEVVEALDAYIPDSVKKNPEREGDLAIENESLIVKVEALAMEVKHLQGENTRLKKQVSDLKWKLKQAQNESKLGAPTAGPLFHGEQSMANIRRGAPKSSLKPKVTTKK